MQVRMAWLAGTSRSMSSPYCHHHSHLQAQYKKMHELLSKDAHGRQEVVRSECLGLCDLEASMTILSGRELRVYFKEHDNRDALDQINHHL